MEDDLFGPPDTKPVVRLPTVTNGVMNIAAVNQLHDELDEMKVALKEMNDKLEAERLASQASQKEIEDKLQGLFGISELVEGCPGTAGISQPYYVEEEMDTDTNQLQTFRYQTICTHKWDGHQFCAEELRLEDYFRGRRYAEGTSDKKFGAGPLLGFDYSFTSSKAPRGFVFGSHSTDQDKIEKELTARTSELNKMLEAERQKSHAFEDKLKNSSLEDFLTQNAIAKGQFDSKVKENIDQGVRKIAEQLEQQKKDTERLLEDQRRNAMALDETLMSLSERRQVQDFVAHNQFIKSMVAANIKEKVKQQLESSSQHFVDEKNKLEQLLEDERKRSKTLEDQLSSPTEEQLRELLKQSSTLEDIVAADIKKKVEQEMGDMAQQLEDDKERATLALAAVEDMLKVAQTKVDTVEECMMKDPSMQVLQVWEKICTVTVTPIKLQDLTAPVESDSTGTALEETYTDPLRTVDNKLMELSGQEHSTPVSTTYDLFQPKSAFVVNGRALLNTPASLFTPLPSISKTPSWPAALRIFGGSTEAIVGFRQEPSICGQSSEVTEGKRALVGGEENEPPAKRARDDNEE